MLFLLIFSNNDCFPFISKCIAFCFPNICREGDFAPEDVASSDMMKNVDDEVVAMLFLFG